MKVIIAGMAAVGKSTVAKSIAKKFKMELICGGDLMKKVAFDAGYNSLMDGWWEKAEGITFLKNRRSDTRFDKLLDMKMMELLDRDNVVATAWTMPWLYKKEDCVKIWLKASQEIRAQRMSTRNNITFEKALTVIKKRDEENIMLYRGLYNFDLGQDLSPFDLVLDTTRLNAKEVKSVVIRVVSLIMENKTALSC